MIHAPPIGSVQLRRFIAARRSGVPVEEAAAAVEMPIGEARAWDADETKGELGWVGEPPPPAGHNSGETTMADNVSADQLRLFVERIERLREEMKGMQDDIKDVYLEAKGQGFDGPTIRECVKLRAIDRDKRAEKQALLETYGTQLGLF